MMLPGIRLLRPLSFGFGVEVWAAVVGDHSVVARRWFGPAIEPDAGIIPDADRLFRLSHPRLQKLLWSGFDDDGTFVQISDWVEGESLKSLSATREGAGVRGNDLSALLADGLRALTYLHTECPDAPLLHGDISPSNMIVGESEGAGTLTLIDVRGIPSGTRAGGRRDVILGTLHFMADEVLSGEPPSTASEIWSLAAAIAAGTGTILPWAGDNTPNEVLRTRRGPAGNIATSIKPSIPAELSSILKEMLAPSPEDRPTAAAALERLALK